MNYTDATGQDHEVNFADRFRELAKQVKGLPALEVLVAQLESDAEILHDIIVSYEQLPEPDSSAKEELGELLETLVDVFGRGIRAPAELWSAGQAAARRSELVVRGL